MLGLTEKKMDSYMVVNCLQIGLRRGPPSSRGEVGRRVCFRLRSRRARSIDFQFMTAVVPLSPHEAASPSRRQAWRRVPFARAPCVGKLPWKETPLASARPVEAKTVGVSHVGVSGREMACRTSTLDDDGIATVDIDAGAHDPAHPRVVAALGGGMG